VAQVQEPYTAINFLVSTRLLTKVYQVNIDYTKAERVPVERVLNLKPTLQGDKKDSTTNDDDYEWTAWDICEGMTSVYIRIHI
jgi:hypothetical protein